jgi:hypothetical protein
MLVIFHIVGIMTPTVHRIGSASLVGFRKEVANQRPAVKDTTALIKYDLFSKTI